MPISYRRIIGRIFFFLAQYFIAGERRSGFSSTEEDTSSFHCADNDNITGFYRFIEQAHVSVSGVVSWLEISIWMIASLFVVRMHMLVARF